MEKINCDFGPAAMIRIPGAQVLDLTKSRLRAAGLFSTLANEEGFPLGHNVGLKNVWTKT